MMKCSLLSLLLFTACLPMADDQAKIHSENRPGTQHSSASSLVLMALNAEFLWDGVPPEEGDAQFAWKGSQQAAEAHMADLADIVTKHDPDILHLAEVENLQALTTFNQKFLSDQGYRPYLVNGTDTATGQDVALLSRFELEGISRDPRKGRSGNRRKAVSKHYIATLRLGDLRLGLVGIHLLARPQSQSRIDDREAQADAVRRMARDLKDTGHSIIVWGDFNDFDGHTLDRSSNRPITRVLEWIRELDPADPTDDLINVAERLPQRQRYTNGRDAIDHILLSPELAERVTEIKIPRDHDPHRVTNHYPIVVHLRLTPDSSGEVAGSDN